MSIALFLTSIGLFPIPMVGGAGWAIPLTPFTFVAVVPKEAEHDVFRFWSEHFPILSVGIKGAHVILPPNKPVTVTWLRDARELATDFVQSTIRIHSLMTDVIAPIARAASERQPG